MLESQSMTDTKPITWTCDPPEFAAYINIVSVVSHQDYVAALLDMRCKRVPIAATERHAWDEATGAHVNTGALDITFHTLDAEADIIYPQRLGPYTGEIPTVTIHHGRSDLHIEAESQGRYSVRVFLTRQIERDAIDINPGDDATKVAHDRGVNDR